MRLEQRVRGGEWRGREAVREGAGAGLWRILCVWKDVIHRAKGAIGCFEQGSDMVGFAPVKSHLDHLTPTRMTVIPQMENNKCW